MSRTEPKTGVEDASAWECVRRSMKVWYVTFALASQTLSGAPHAVQSTENAESTLLLCLLVHKNGSDGVSWPRKCSMFKRTWTPSQGLHNTDRLHSTIIYRHNSNLPISCILDCFFRQYSCSVSLLEHRVFSTSENIMADQAQVVFRDMSYGNAMADTDTETIRAALQNILNLVIPALKEASPNRTAFLSCFRTKANWPVVIGRFSFS